ncbi:p53 and DNA damage-regulated protein 1 [Myripristis murdjan]|uniref:p53 and DNA damage-regulated protein 1 n=1 Tax=Myripristis murdjan TaxID=586833 RepID=A0A667ZAR3_9TELE|nr:p53 and DNA damage-regulated protein 1 [Myripristis murdjan]
MDATSKRILEYLTEVEEAAEDVLTNKQQIVDLDAKRNRNREALSALRNDIPDSEKVKVCFGNMFIKLPKSKTREMIQRDQEQLDKEINDLRKGLKAKVNHLQELQGKPELRGYSLSPLSADEIKAINSLLKR